MGRSQLKYNRGRGRGRGAGGTARPHRQQQLQSNAYRYEDRDEDKEVAQEVAEDDQSFAQRQHFANDKVQYRQGSSQASYFQSSTVKEWEDDTKDDRKSLALDFDWIAAQLATVPPSIRYKIDPKYGVDSDYEEPATQKEQDEQDAEIEKPTEPTNLPQKQVVVSTTEGELDQLLALSSHATPSSCSSKASIAAAAAATTISEPSTNQLVITTHEQLEDWLDDVLEV